MLESCIIQHVFCNPSRADRANSCFGLESMLFLEVATDRGDVVILIAVGATEIRQDLLLHRKLIDAQRVWLDVLPVLGRVMPASLRQRGERSRDPNPSICTTT